MRGTDMYNQRRVDHEKNLRYKMRTPNPRPYQVDMGYGCRWGRSRVCGLRFADDGKVAVFQWGPIWHGRCDDNSSNGSIPMIAMGFIANAGLGKDIWHVDFDDITKVLYIYFWDEWIYFSALIPTKLSLHFFYLRIFPKRSFRIAIYVVMAVTLAYGIVFIIVSVFQCSPIKLAWLRWDGETPGRCNNINLQGWTSAAFNIVLDLVTLALPLRELSKMDLWRKKKIHICIMFSVGSFVTIVSILRLHTLLKFATSHNFTWDYVEMGYWSTIEIHVGIICACMPAMRSLLRRLFPSFFSYTQHQKSGTFGNSSSHEEPPMQNPQRMPPKLGFHESDSLPLVDVYNPRTQYSYFNPQ
ncbi:hypothetical protein GX51_05834 [Blastomyces parvus]|uniref:Rhodopsin domain-containing protein n=1 Tax=Blastomyces parvus TaxID=2060905 RepID=A0A2B7WUF5_9EURO|nr:hypothetical protein GX51_05834 [Blastomyces parvus]